MTATPDTAAGQLLELLRDGDVDAAIESGLMTFDVASMPGGHAPEACALLEATRRRLQVAWDARERYRQRQARLARIADARAARRTAAMSAAPASTSTSLPTRPALPGAAASALARALAKASSGKASNGKTS